VSADKPPRPGGTSPVLLVVSGATVSRPAIARAARLAANAPVIVVGLAGESPAETEEARRAVALAMTALGNTGVMAHAHIAASGSPVRAITRVARARGARIVVLDQHGGLAAELRRRMYGSGVTVLAVTEPPGRRPGPRDLAG
jgi:hypothetical protein